MNQNKITTIIKYTFLAVITSFCFSMLFIACGQENGHTHKWLNLDSDGVNHYTVCVSCGERKNEQPCVYNTHNDDTGLSLVCDVCNHTSVYDGKATVKLYEDDETVQREPGYVFILENSNGYEHFDFPAEFGGKPVYSVGARSNTLKSVTIPDSVTVIIGHAFTGCTALTEIAIPDTVTDIKLYAFKNCTSLKKVILSNSLKSIYDEAFANCTALNEISFPNSLETISHSAFANCTSIINIDITDSVNYIGSDAFLGCTSLSEIVIPATVESIGASAFAGCTALKRAEVYGKGNTINPAQGSSYTLLANIFENCTSLVSAVVSGNDRLGSTFKGCTSLINVMISNRVTSIGNETFSGCKNSKSSMPTK